MSVLLNISDFKIPFAVSLISGILFLISGILYSYSGASTGYVLVVIGLIVVLSAIRMKNGVLKDVKDGSLGVLFFGILNLISFVFILSGVSETDTAFLSGLMGSVAGIFGGYLGILYSKSDLTEN
ncbi:MAG: hypothetical protein JXQ82_05945 [Methanomicrobiaceae archaeon]|nr:hypothetical protein [Methanomicrobiaceae archaeon]